MAASVTGSTVTRAWHSVARLRPELREGALSLAYFAADLGEVARGTETRAIYSDPAEFFALTYPTLTLRDLVKDVASRLDGHDSKPVQRLSVTYGGGKTHTLVTLLHLFRDGTVLPPKLSSIAEIRAHAARRLTPSRVAALAFDKLDTRTGMPVRGPDGVERQLRYPWSVIAFQIAGERGLEILNPGGSGTERDDPPADPTIREVLRVPHEDDLSTLILFDEVLYWVRLVVANDVVWKDRVGPFFQALTQAVAATPRCALVASLLASQMEGTTSGILTPSDVAIQDVVNAFQRVDDEGVLPVSEGDVAEVLRRRFFTPESIANPQAYRQAVIGALSGVKELDQETENKAVSEEQRYLKAYPFHPDLLDVLYGKWTQLASFQRTRGVLRTFAIALRDAERWDESPLVGPQVFLHAPGPEPLEVSGALTELTPIASSQDPSRQGQDWWRPILDHELRRAREVQEEYPGIRHREVEGAVVATFLHSQPTGKSAELRQLLVFAGPTKPGKIELLNALRRYAETSWFLDERALKELQDAKVSHAVPLTWRLGPEANLTQVHDQAMRNLGDDAGPTSIVGARIAKAIEDAKLLRDLTGTDAKAHVLPKSPGDVGDDGSLRLVLLGLEVSGTERSLPQVATRYLTEYLIDRPRVKKNAVIVLVASPENAMAARTAVRRLMAWEQVRDNRGVMASASTARKELLAGYVSDAQKHVPQIIASAYVLAVSMSEKGAIGTVLPGTGTLFARLKALGTLKLKDGPASYMLLQPGSSAWPAGRDTYPLGYLRGAFAERPGLERFVRASDLEETIRNGCEAGAYVIQARRPDGSFLTAWRERPSDALLGDDSAEVVMTAAATLTRVDPRLVAPISSDHAWSPERALVTRIVAWFDGTQKVDVDGDKLAVPRAESSVVHAAIAEAVLAGTACLRNPTAAFWREALDPEFVGQLDGAEVVGPPTPIPASSVLRGAMPDAWVSDGDRWLATAASLRAGMETLVGYALPWVTVKSAITDALAARAIDLIDGWPCTQEHASVARFAMGNANPPPPPAIHRYVVDRSFGDTFTVQNLGKAYEALRKAASDLGATVSVSLKLTLDDPGNADPATLALIKAKLEEIKEGLSG